MTTLILIIFIAAIRIGGLCVLLLLALMVMAHRGEREMEKLAAARQNPGAGTSEAGYHPGSLAEPRD